MTHTSRLVTGSELSASRLASLLESARLLHSSFEIDRLLSHLLRTVMGRLMVGRAVIAVRDQNELRIARVRGASSLEPGQLFDRESAQKAGLEYFFSIGDDQENPVGILALGSVLRSLSQEDEEFLDALLGIAASGISNARSHNEAQRLNESLNQKIQDLRTLLELVQSLTSTLDAEEVAHLLVLTLTGRWAVGRFALSVSKEGHPPIRRERGLQFPSDEVLQQELEGVRTPVLTDDLADGSLKAELAERNGEVLFPLRSGDRILGAVALGRRPGEMRFTRADLEFGNGLIAHAIVAFENAWYFEETLEREQIEREIQVAAGIQQDLFPSSLPSPAGLQMVARSRAARQVGGDYYDVIPLLPDESGDYLLCVADVSGKGIPASLLMSSIQATLRALLAEKEDLVDLVTRTSELLYATTQASKYATAFIARIKSSSGQIEFVNAGHNDGFLLGNDGELRKLASTGPPIGLIPNIPFEMGRIALNAGDLLVLYSDGVIEAQNLREEEYGEERLLSILKDSADLPASQILDRVFLDVDDFAGNTPQHDDITLMIIKSIVE